MCYFQILQFFPWASCFQSSIDLFLVQKKVFHTVEYRPESTLPPLHWGGCLIDPSWSSFAMHPSPLPSGTNGQSRTSWHVGWLLGCWQCGPQGGIFTQGPCFCLVTSIMVPSASSQTCGAHCSALFSKLDPACYALE